MANLKFKHYTQDQPLLLPPALDDLIEPTHLVRVVNSVIEGLDRAALLKKVRCQPGGQPPFDPVMMLKVLVYAYAQELYSCRAIAKALRENVHFLWLAATEAAVVHGRQRLPWRVPGRCLGAGVCGSR